MLLLFLVTPTVIGLFERTNSDEDSIVLTPAIKILRLDSIYTVFNNDIIQSDVLLQPYIPPIRSKILLKIQSINISNKQSPHATTQTTPAHTP